MARLPRAPKVKLEITDELIEDAIPRDSSHCLWADAVKAAVPHATYISVDIQTIRFSDPTKGLRYTYLTPRTAQIALVQFDQGIRPEPHSVVLKGGQVTNARKKVTSGRPLTDAETAQRKAASAKSRVALGKATLRKGDARQGQSVAVRTGGQTPPIAAGKRRAFGLRGLDY